VKVSTRAHRHSQGQRPCLIGTPNPTPLFPFTTVTVPIDVVKFRPFFFFFYKILFLLKGLLLSRDCVSATGWYRMGLLCEDNWNVFLLSLFWSSVVFQISLRLCCKNYVLFNFFFCSKGKYRPICSLFYFPVINCCTACVLCMMCAVFLIHGIYPAHDLCDVFQTPNSHCTIVLTMHCFHCCLLQRPKSQC
jgi:hypothetical protein